LALDCSHSQHPQNGAQLTSQKKSLSHGDLVALSEFVNERLAELPTPQNPGAPTLSDLIEQKPDAYRAVVDLLSQG
jgi:hypothetical protein